VMAAMNRVAEQLFSLRRSIVESWQPGWLKWTW